MLLILIQFFHKYVTLFHFQLSTLHGVPSQVAEIIRHVIDSHTQPIPAVLEIPSKDHPYDASKDSILRRAKVHTNIFVVSAYCLI